MRNVKLGHGLFKVLEDEWTKTVSIKYRATRTVLVLLVFLTTYFYPAFEYSRVQQRCRWYQENQHCPPKIL